jgi:hypothetical protein
LLNVENNKLFLALSSWVSFVASVVVTSVVAIVVIVVAATIGGSLCYYTFAN